MDSLKKMANFAVSKGASDLHLVVSSRPTLRIDGELFFLKKPKITKADLDKLSKELLNVREQKVLQDFGDIDIGLQIDTVSLRINIHRQLHGLGMAIRLIPSHIPSVDEILLPDVVIQAVKEHESGIIIISGPAGSGKTTTLATLVQLLNDSFAKHIITLEDPVEYTFSNAKSLIEQRQLGRDFPSFASGLRHVLRQDPNVIVLGEMRDPETISLAITAAETGHLVLSTLHAPNATEVVERIVNAFDGAAQNQILIQFASTLRLVVAQQLLPAKNGGRIPIRELLVGTTAVQNAIRRNNLPAIRSAIETGRKYGMMSMKQALVELKKDDLIV